MPGLSLDALPDGSIELSGYEGTRATRLWTRAMPRRKAVTA